MSMADPESVTCDETLVRGLLAAQFPQWAQLPLTPVPRPGVDNTTFRLGGALSVRLPRYERWAGQVEREHRWLPELAPHLPLPISQPLAKGEPGEGYPHPWSVYRWLDGERATPQGLADPVEAAQELAGFIAALRRIDAADGPGPQWSNAFRGVPMGDDRDSIAAAARVLPKLAALRTSGPAAPGGPLDPDGAAAVWEAALAAPAWDRPPVWTHGDLAEGNLLSADGALSAVIDFGTLGVGDPAVDLLPAWTFLPSPAREPFRAALDTDDATWARGRGWALATLLPEPGRPLSEDARHRLAELIADL
ncbi:aminoglycoside phosphotransferase family protein [Streptomyces amakusaensis]